MNQREIKFRAWDNKKKEWLLGYEMSNLGGFSLFGECVLLGEWSHILDTFLFDRDGYKAEDLIVMQYTGLKDKNGKEIYEGDIVKAATISDVLPTGESQYEEEIIEIDWNKEAAGFDLMTFDAFEVIGNIYENPKLLNP